jgi:hypothetical protein
MIRALILILAMFLASCSHSDDDNGPILPGGDEDDRIFNEQPDVDEMASAAKGATYRYYNVGDGGRMAWRIPVKGTAFGRSFVVRFSNGYAIRVPNSARRCSARNGFVYRPGIGSIKSGTGTSHGGVYIYAPRGNKSTSLTILR